ncbi:MULTISPECIES: two-component system regulatory protein YycI [Thermoactinomyces]|jgi:regulatory protein YycI of two-component signal transduction system YycFG|uniref:Two-component system regulatory protein YycI n=1 Tax=Thermoactinomyces daqus TaxID=1329516 RepID=A0A7W2AGQ9_9BACL|nr:MULTISPECIES: two-component system regulatory protein YycI [Thermoactinomyces]MBA4541906.1 two-component system regulatory protein YycI [Thermoactinomyces daqus]MBH8597905.1 two-component system regulatory protein YycI [Thermoactinomyces sp. CICC 10523]MBH8604258.1 two-component system regulatory protein YycI [Thermoactinomyces sp. CICC 10522]MBH8607713.1 two-component system regulatory protein YycI [Thermoactinomyces sp. CICC 10521]
MDWSRAKTIFIIAFLILDLFLGAQLSHTMQQQSQFVEENDISAQQLQQLLKQAKIKFAVKAPSPPEQLDTYKATITAMDNSWNRDEKGGYIKEFRNPLSYRNQHELEGILHKEIPFFGEFDYMPALSTPSKKLVYLQMVGNRPIYDGKIEVNLSGSHRIHSIHVTRFQLEKVQAVQLVPFNNVLYRFVTGWNKTDFTISSATLGYQAKVYPGTSEDYWLIPCWCFRVGNSHLLVNATNRGGDEDVETGPGITK